jgi:hypothetical protein
MAWGDRKPEGTKKAQLPSGFLSPQAVGAGPVNITVQEDEFRVAIERYPNPVKINTLDSGRHGPMEASTVHT